MNKKYILFFVTVLLTFSLCFCACSREVSDEGLTQIEPLTEESTTESISLPEEESESMAETTVAISAESTVTETEAPEQTDAPTSTEAPQTAAPQTAAPQTAAPQTEPPAAEANVDEMAASIAANTAMFEERLEQSSANRGLSVFGIDAADVANASYYAASAAVAEEVLVVRAADSAAVSAIVNAMESHKATQIEDYADYVPKEVPKLENAIIYTNGNTVIYCVANDSAAAEAAVAGLF